MFPLGVSHLTNTKLHNLQQKYIATVLNKMGFLHTYPQAIVFGPATHGEIGSIYLRIEHRIMIVTEIMRTLKTPEYGQDILRIFLIAFQHTLDRSLPLLEYLNQRAPQLKGHYYVYLRKFFSENMMQFEFSCVFCPELKHKNNIFSKDAA